jgi:hypothetical protein
LASTGRTIGRRLRSAGPLPILLAALATAGCGGGASATAETTPTTTAAAAPSVAHSAVQDVTFGELNTAIRLLYRHRPAIRTFTVRNVEYTPATRDRVLAVCRRGGIETDPAERESVRLAGCAPLIFFFYNYGARRSAPDALDVARKVYWYAVSDVDGPYDARQALTNLLRSWGIP